MKIEFGKIPELSESQLWVFPYRSDIKRIFEHMPENTAFLGWNAISLRELIGRIQLELFPQKKQLRPPTRFAIVHRVLLQYDYLNEFDELKQKTGIAESLVELFVVLDEAAILTKSDVETLFPKVNEQTKDALTLYIKFREELARQNYLTEGDILTQATDFLSDDNLNSQNKNIPNLLHSKEKIVFHNFLEFTIPQREFIKRLSDKFEVIINYSSPANFFPVQWREIIEKLAMDFSIQLKFPQSADGHWLSDALSGKSERAHRALRFDGKHIPNFALLELPDPQREVEFVVKMAKIIMIENKISPHNIYVITPRPERYEALLNWQFQESNIPFSSGQKYSSNNYIQILLEKILTALRTDWRRKEVFQLLKHPIIKSRLPYRDDLFRIERECIRRKIHSRKNWLEWNNVEIAPIRNLIKELDSIKEFNNPKRLTELLDKIATSISNCGIEDSAGVKSDFLAGISNNKRALYIQQWNELYSQAEQLAEGYGEFHKLDGVKLLSVLLHIYRPPSFNSDEYVSGIKLITVEESRDNRAEVAFFIGFGKNNFPTYPKKNAILEQEYNEFVPFVSDKIWVENLSLILSMMSAKRFYLTYPRKDGEEDISAGQPIDEIFRFCIQDNADIPTGTTLSTYLQGYLTGISDRVYAEAQEILQDMIPPERELKFPSFWEYRDKSISVSQLEQYANCPFKYLCSVIIGEAEPTKLEETLSMIELGNAIHKILESFYREKYEEIPHIQFPKFDYDISWENIRAHMETIQNNYN
ncbi:hypothetical protein DRQ33_02360, partial [bacterium]